MPAPLSSKEMDALERAATCSALTQVRTLWQGDGPAINPKATLASLGDHELGWIVATSIAHWICKRAEHAALNRIDPNKLILTMSGEDGSAPEMWEAGAIAVALPYLGNAVHEMGMTQRPIGDWSKDQITKFVWMCFRTLDDVRTARDETPSDPPFDISDSPLLG